jgi:hypothetical protein
MTELLGKQLNFLFQRMYTLTEEVLLELKASDDFVTYNYNNEQLKTGVTNFIASITTAKEPWSEDNNGHFFEAGYHDYIRVFYPFADDQMIFDKTLMYNYKNNWITYLRCVTKYATNVNNSLYAFKLQTELCTLFQKI